MHPTKTNLWLGIYFVYFADDGAIGKSQKRSYVDEDEDESGFGNEMQKVLEVFGCEWRTPPHPPSETSANFEWDPKFLKCNMENLSRTSQNV